MPHSGSNNEQIDSWLAGLGLSAYVGTFAVNGVSHDILPELNDADLRELGVEQLGHRKLILRAIREQLLVTNDGQNNADTVRLDPRKTERRQITTMFCDLVGSTDYSVRLSPEAVHSMIVSFQQCCAEIVQRYQGYVARYSGDGVLIYFGYPRAYELEPERAVRAGLEIAAAIPILVQPDGVVLHCRIGIATGNVLIADIQAVETAFERSAVGATVNLAARIQGIAAPGTVLIAESTHRIVRGLFEYEALDPANFKGFPERVPVYRVVASDRTRSRFEALSEPSKLTRLIDREEEMELLARRWASVQAGRGQVVLLSGEAGIGKSRLVREHQAKMVPKPGCVLRFFGSPHFRNRALHPVIRSIELSAGISPNDSADELSAKLTALLEKLSQTDGSQLAVLTALLSPPGSKSAIAEGHSSGEQRSATLELLENIHVAAAEKGPILVIFEDLHWMDPTTLEFVNRLVSRAEDLQLLVLLTARPGLIPDWSSRHHATLVTLNQLDERQCRTLVNSVIWQQAQVPKSVEDQIVSRASGIPLYLEELTKLALSIDELTLASAFGDTPGSIVPPTLRDALVARLDNVAKIEIVQICAIIGQRFAVKHIAELYDGDASDIKNAVEEMVSADLIRSWGESADAPYEFKHALLRDAAEASIPLDERIRLHKRMVCALEREAGEGLPDAPDTLAHHCIEAGMRDKAIAYLQRAGRHAAGMSAYGEAIQHFDRALSLSKEPAQHKRQWENELDLLTELGAALAATERFSAPRVRKVGDQARELTSRVGDQEAVNQTIDESRISSI